MGYVCEYINSARINLIWYENDVIHPKHKERLIEENVNFDDYKNIVEDYKNRYGAYGFDWTTVWNNENSEGFGLEYIDRGFNS